MEGLTAVGLMSGTSMDGIDVALVKSDGLSSIAFGPSHSVPYPPKIRDRIKQGLVEALDIKLAANRCDRPGSLETLERDLTDAHVEAVQACLSAHSLGRDAINLIGFHGQTVLHRPEIALTVQLGDGPRMADRLGTPTVYDFRAEDMKHGGQGAPLIPVFHQALAQRLVADGIATFPVAFVNIGGIANVSYIDHENDPIAFDTGPGNALLDQWMEEQAGIPFDQGGRIASEGRVDDAIVKRVLGHTFFDVAGPKSLDRGDFLPLTDSLDLADGAATLAAVTARSIARAREHFPKPPKCWIIGGGGRLNTTLMTMLATELRDDKAVVWTAEQAGLDGDMLEAQAFAYLAIRSEKALPLTFPTTTGCKAAVAGGLTAKPASQV
ncbi:MAG: anhydro-N-acetylmuramic acid kinase [Pseudomonadota bacterium]